MGQRTYDTEKLRAIPIAKLYGKETSRRVMHVRCPIHSEKTASFAIYADNSFHCFGCSAHGRGAIDFVMALDPSLSFTQACDELTKYV